MRRIAPEWLAGCTLRDIWFQPTFHKHVGQLCNGVFIHAEGPRLRSCGVPAVAAAGARRSRRSARSIPDYDLWRDFPYEYVFDKLAIDVINGGPALARMGRRCRRPQPGDLDALTIPDEQAWAEQRQPHLIY